MILRARLGVLGLFFLSGLAACGGDDPTGTSSASSTSGAGGGGAGGAGGAGGGEACPPGSHASAGGCEAELVGWTAGPLLATARDHHITFLAETPTGTFLYAALGASSSGLPLSSAERASVAEDGSLGPFEAAAKLPAGVIGAGFAQVGNGFIIAGGLKSDGASTAETWIGFVNDDGDLAYTAGPAMTAARYHVALVAAKGFVFTLGGLQQTVENGMPKQEVSDLIERASFDGTSIAGFQAAGALPSKLTHHTAIAHGDAIYVIGGGSGADASADILRATVDGGGALGAWEVVGKLPEGRATSSATVFLDHLYVFAGMAKLTGSERDTVLRAPLLPDGKVGTFTELTALPKQRAHSHQTPLHAGFFYSVGGSIMHKPQEETFLGQLQ